jgi:hypothetical protein
MFFFKIFQKSNIFWKNIEFFYFFSNHIFIYKNQKILYFYEIKNK